MDILLFDEQLEIPYTSVITEFLHLLSVLKIGIVGRGELVATVTTLFSTTIIVLLVFKIFGCLSVVFLNLFRLTGGINHLVIISPKTYRLIAFIVLLNKALAIVSNPK